MSDNIAVLIDGENIDPLFAEKIFSFARSLGTLTVREIYGSGIALNAWSDPILKYTIHTNFTLRPNRFKNSSDIALVIGAMELLASARTAQDKPDARCDKVIIVSSDSDFSPLAVHLRSAGIEVIGMGEPKNTNPMWPKACSRYVELTEDAPAQKSAQSKRAAPQSSPTEGKAERKPEPEAKKEAQPAARQASSKADGKPESDGKKDAPLANKPAKTEPEEKKPSAEQQPQAEPAPQPDAKKPAQAEQKVAPSHRERMEIIRSAISEQIAARGGRIRSGDLFKALANLPDYKYDQQRSNRNPLDYLTKQYNAWFVFEPGEKGSSWISERPAEGAQTAAVPAVENVSAEDISAEDVSRTEPAGITGPEPAAPAEGTTADTAAPSPAPTLEENLTASGVPQKDAARAASILPKCRNMRDVYNRMRGAFGKDAGKAYYEIVKGLVQTSVFSFPPRPQNPVKPAEKDVLRSAGASAGRSRSGNPRFR